MCAKDKNSAQNSALCSARAMTRVSNIDERRNGLMLHLIMNR
jgi:hypothetical protein